MKVTIVCGAPASGKTTYVTNHMKRGDLIVDLDELKKAISFCEKDEVPYHLTNMALELRRHLMSAIRDRLIQCDAWVIAAKPQKEIRLLADQIGADIVEMKATQEECIDRAMRDAERVDKKKQIAIISKYFYENQQEINQ